MSEFRRSLLTEEFEEATVPDCDDRIRYGGPQGQDDDEAKRKEREAKKAEVRKRLEEAGAKGKKKKGFLTPERKKKLRKLLMMKAAEDLKQQQLKKEQERQKILAERTVKMPAIDNIDDAAKLLKIYEELFTSYKKLEENKYDVAALVQAKDAEINELTIAVNDLRGKFVKPSLKKVSKYDNRFKKLGGAAKEGAPAHQDFRSNLKVVKKDIDIEELLKKKDDKPDWSKDAQKKEKTDKPPEPEKKEEKKKEEEAPPAEEAPAEEAEAPEEEEGEEEEGDEEEEEEYARFRLKKPIEPGAQSLRTNLRGVANSKMQLTIAALKLDLNKYHKQETNKPVKEVSVISAKSPPMETNNERNKDNEERCENEESDSETESERSDNRRSPSPPTTVVEKNNKFEQDSDSESEEESEESAEEMVQASSGEDCEEDNDFLVTFADTLV